MKQTEILELSLGDLKDRIVEEALVLRKLKLSNAVSPIENPGKIKITRRNIARFKTELTKRQAQPNN